MENGDILLQAEGLERRDGAVTRVRDLDLSLRRGEVTALLGVNGAGKSTTLALLSGALRPSRGRVTVCGHDLHRQPRRAKRHLGLLPERPALYPGLTVDENLDFAARLHGLRGAELRRAVRRVKKQLDLCTLGRRLASRLSKGMAQRVGIAQALIHDPEVLILDEPTAGLDPAQAQQLRQLIRRLREGRTILLATHLLHDVDPLCGQVLLLREGRLVAREKGNDRQWVRVHFLRPPPADRLEALPGVASVIAEDQGWFEIALSGSPEILLRELANGDWGITDFIRRRHGLEHLIATMIA